MAEAEQLKEWLAKIAMKDSDAFRALYDASSPKLYGFALRIVIKRELAEEVLQESFINIWNNAATYRPKLSPAMAWITTIVRNKAYDTLRRNYHAAEADSGCATPEIVDALESQEPTPIEVLHAADHSKALGTCIGRLDGLHRQIIALAYFNDQSHSEIAQHMKLPIGTVKTWIRRDLNAMRAFLQSKKISINM